jgi:KDO2-lipid IV(A) lauroyltransferase
VKKIIRKLYYILIMFFFKSVRLLPFRAAVRLGGFLGGLCYHLIGKARGVTEDNLRKAFPEKSEDEIRGIAKEVFVNQGKNAFEVFYYPSLSPERLKELVAVENEEGYSKAFAMGKGVLMASAHCANWEFLGAGLSQRGFVINVIAKRVYIDALNELLLKLRSSKGLKIIFRSDSDSAKKMLKALRSGETLAMLIDQDTSVPGVFAEFFGRPAWTPSGLAVLAVKTGAPVILALDKRLADDTHKVVVTGPIELVKTGDYDSDVLANTRLVTKLIEDHIRANPSQWVWMHERWKTQVH